MRIGIVTNMRASVLPHASSLANLPLELGQLADGRQITVCKQEFPTFEDAYPHAEMMLLAFAGTIPGSHSIYVEVDKAEGFISHASFTIRLEQKEQHYRETLQQLERGLP